ncbi:hypothetical protein [uncultured Campylobacter sp.]|uniref:hypothetical protein n=1 Tax=uncultured Campylobacter sp. TaxID=218934 RepID=UPI0026316F58|nr:hypothetical protein [uncultured Campylobacter sp.]
MKPLFKDEAERGLYSEFTKMLSACYPDILKSAIADEPSEFKGGVNEGLVVAFDLFQAISVQREQMQELQIENGRLIQTFLTGASNGAK